MQTATPEHPAGASANTARRMRVTPTSRPARVSGADGGPLRRRAAALCIQAYARGWLARRGAARLQAELLLHRRRARAGEWRRWQQTAREHAPVQCRSVQCFAAAEAALCRIAAEIEVRAWPTPAAGTGLGPTQHTSCCPLCRAGFQAAAGMSVILDHRVKTAYRSAASAPLPCWLWLKV